MSTRTAIAKLKASDVDVASLGVKRKAGRNTKAWGVHLQADVASKIIKLFDDWSGNGKGMKPAAGAKLPGQRYRDEIAAGKPAVVFGVAAPNATYTIVEGLAEQTGKKENFVGAWCIEKGMESLTLEVINKLLPANSTKPSPSLVAVQALLIGLTAYPKAFPPLSEDEKRALASSKRQRGGKSARATAKASA